MIWAVLAVIALCSPLAIAVVGHRFIRSSPVDLERPPLFDFLRSGLALVAAALALLTGLTALADYTIESNPYAGWFFIVAGVAAAVLALYPARGAWGRSRRLGATTLGAVWLAIGFISLPIFIMASACGCGGGWNRSPAPTPLGVDTRSWMLFAVMLGPTLLLLVGSALADRTYAWRHG